MKRKQFEIVVVETGATYTKTTYNAAVRFTETLMGDIANERGANFKLVEKTGRRGVDMLHVEGMRVWEGDNGDLVTFKIKRVDVGK